MRKAGIAATVLVAVSPAILLAQNVPVRTPVVTTQPDTNDQQLPPPELHFCAAHCFTWVLKNGHYRGAAGNFAGDLTVVSFTHDSVILNRVDPPNQ